MYWPLAVIDPAPELASPPETDHTTAAGPPLFSMAENCSTGVPDEFVALQPVQFVSLVEVPGEMEKVPFDAPETIPAPHPASATRAGIDAKAMTRSGQSWPE